MSKTKLLKKIAIIQDRIQELWHLVGTDYGIHCQTAQREMNELEKKIERGEVKPKK